MMTIMNFYAKRIIEEANFNAVNATVDSIFQRNAPKMTKTKKTIKPG